MATVKDVILVVKSRAMEIVLVNAWDARLHVEDVVESVMEIVNPLVPTTVLANVRRIILDIVVKKIVIPVVILHVVILHVVIVGQWLVVDQVMVVGMTVKVDVTVVMTDAGMHAPATVVPDVLETVVENVVIPVVEDVPVVVMHATMRLVKRLIVGLIVLANVLEDVITPVVLIHVRLAVLVPPIQEILYFYYYINTFND